MADKKSGKVGKSPRYSEAYGANRPNPYTGYLPPGAAPAGQLYHPESINMDKVGKMVSESATDLAKTAASRAMDDAAEKAAEAAEAAAAEAARQEEAARQHPVQPRHESSPQRKKNRKSDPSQQRQKAAEQQKKLQFIQDAATTAMVTEVLSETITNAVSSSKAEKVEAVSGTSSKQKKDAPTVTAPDGTTLREMKITDDDGNVQTVWVPASTAYNFTRTMPKNYFDPTNFDDAEVEDIPFDKNYKSKKDISIEGSFVIPTAEELLGTAAAGAAAVGAAAAGAAAASGELFADSGFVPEIYDEDYSEEYDNSEEYVEDEEAYEAGYDDSADESGEYEDEEYSEEYEESEDEEEFEEYAESEDEEESEEYDESEAEEESEEYVESEDEDESEEDDESEDEEDSEEDDESENEEDSEEYAESEDEEESEEDESEDEEDSEDYDDEEYDEDDDFGSDEDMIVISGESPEAGQLAVAHEHSVLHVSSSSSDDDENSRNQDDSLFIRQEKPAGSTTVFNLPEGVKLPAYINDDEFLEQWLNEGEDMAAKNKRQRRRISTIIGTVTMLLAMVGFIWILRTAFGAIAGMGNTDATKTKYEDYIAPVAMCDVQPFESWSAIPADKLLQSSIFHVLINMEESYYETDDTNKIIIPSRDVTNSAHALYGDEAQLNPDDLNVLDGDDVYYSDTDDCFHVAATGISGPQAKVINISKKGNEITLSVGFLGETDAEDSEDYYQTMDYVLRTVGDSYYISAIRTPAEGE